MKRHLQCETGNPFAAIALLVAIMGTTVAATRADAAEAANIDEVMTAIEAAAKDVKSWSADVAMTGEMMGQKIEYSGKLTAKGKLNRMVMEMNIMDQAMKMETLLDKDNMMWMIMDVGGMKMAMKTDYNVIGVQAGAMGVPGMSGAMGMGGGSVMPENPGMILRLLAESYDVELKGSDTVGGNAVYVIEGQAKDAFKEALDQATGDTANATGLSFDRVRIHIDKKTGLNRRLAYLTGAGETVMTMDYSNIEVNPELDDGFFVYTPEEGVVVTDMTNMVGAVLGGGR